MTVMQHCGSTHVRWYVEEPASTHYHYIITLNETTFQLPQEKTWWKTVWRNEQGWHENTCVVALCDAKLHLWWFKSPFGALIISILSATLTSQVTAPINSRRSDELSYEKHKLRIIRSSYWAKIKGSCSGVEIWTGSMGQMNWVQVGDTFVTVTYWYIL